MDIMKRLLAAAALAALVGGCAGPRIVRNMATTREGKFRLLYDRNLGMGAYEQGLIDCKAQSTGAITDCQPVRITFKED
jgi:hypothetical protein